MLDLRSCVLLALSSTISNACRTPAVAPEDPVDVAYEIRAPRADDGSIVITMQTRATSDGACAFDREIGWGGTKPEDTDIADVQMIGADGRKIELEHPTPGAWSAHARPDEPLTISWRLPRNENLVSAVHNDHYRPVVAPDIFHAIGNLALFAPVHAKHRPAISIRLTWKGFAEIGWKTACSFGSGAVVSVRRQIEEFQQAVYIAGKFTILERDVHGRTLAVALPESGFDGAPAEFADLCARVVTAQRAFFDDWDYPYYLITALATGTEDRHSMMLGGTGLTDSFALFLQRGADLNAGTHIHAQVEHVLAHEMFHNWCGRWTPIAEPERQCYWFSEGFTEFFTRRMLVRCGLTDVEAFAASLQKSLHDYAQNPRRNATNQAIADGFWSEREASEMPYRRGDLLAAFLDHAIRTRTKSEKSLDDFMREAVKLGRAGERLTVDVLLARIERWTDKQLADVVRGIVVDGASIELAKDTFAPCLSIETAEFPAYDPGFDVDTTVAEKAIRGVRNGSAAWNAGLRDGQALRGLSTEKRADKPMRIDVEVEGAIKTIEFVPAGAPVVLPFVRVASSEPCAVL